MSLRLALQATNRVLSEMSQAARDRLPSSAFVFPDRRAWPVQTPKQARIAIWYMNMGRGDSADYAAVKAEIRKRYPSLIKEGVNKIDLSDDELMEVVQDLQESITEDVKISKGVLLEIPASNSAKATFDAFHSAAQGVGECLESLKESEDDDEEE